MMISKLAKLFVQLGREKREKEKKNDSKNGFSVFELITHKYIKQQK